jgi:hypothetical protein
MKLLHIKKCVEKNINYAIPFFLVFMTFYQIVGWFFFHYFELTEYPGYNPDLTGLMRFFDVLINGYLSPFLSIILATFFSLLALNSKEYSFNTLDFFYHMKLHLFVLPVVLFIYGTIYFCGHMLTKDSDALYILVIATFFLMSMIVVNFLVADSINRRYLNKVSNRIRKISCCVLYFITVSVLQFVFLLIEERILNKNESTPTNEPALFFSNIYSQTSVEEFVKLYPNSKITTSNCLSKEMGSHNYAVRIDNFKYLECKGKLHIYFLNNRLALTELIPADMSQCLNVLKTVGINLENKKQILLPKIMIFRTVSDNNKRSSAIVWVDQELGDELLERVKPKNNKSCYRFI